MFAKISRLSLFCLLFLTACGGGGSGEGRGEATVAAVTAGADVTVFSGTLVGSVIAGVHYRAVLDEISREGVTGIDGAFSYFSRKGAVATVTFAVGNMVLGSTKPLPVAGQKITVFDLVDATDPEADSKAMNLYRFLRSLAKTDSVDSLEISASVQAVLAGVGEKRLADLAPVSFDGELGGALALLSSSGEWRRGLGGWIPREAVETHILQTKLQVDADRIKGLTLLTGSKSIPADGVGQVLLRAEVRDGNGQVVPGVRVQFQTTAGSLSLVDGTVRSAVRLTNASGQASVFLTAARQPLTATVAVRAGGWSEIGTVAFVVPEPSPVDTAAGSQADKSASVQLAVEESHLFVQGVGKVEQTQITVIVLDHLGTPLDETARGYSQNANNLRVTLQTHPGGGEKLVGVRRTLGAGSGANLETVSDGQVVTVRTSAGQAVLHLHAGNLPGVVQLKAELLDTDGVTVVTTALSTLVAVASGPPTGIVLTRSNSDVPINLGVFGLGGIYCQAGAVLVTDRYGNAVPDGTVISLGLVDTVIHEGSGRITKNSPDLTLIAAQSGFSQSFVAATTGGGRSILGGDRMLISMDISPADRSRLVKTTGSAVLLGADVAYLRAAGDPESQDVHYLVGAALRGGAVHGYSEVRVFGKADPASCDPAKLTTGMTTTVGGMAPVRMTYPATTETILNGCFADLTTDKRLPNPRSAQVWTIASTADSAVTAMDQGGFCFHAATPSRLLAIPEALSRSASLTITLEDAGGVRLPYVAVHCTPAVTANYSGKMVVAVTPATGAVTGQDGRVLFDVVVAGGGGTSSDVADVVCLAMDARLVVPVRVP